MLATAGCDCNEGPAVPFKHPDALQKENTSSEQGERPPEGSGDAGLRRGQRFVDAPSRVELAAGTLEKKGGHIHATLSTGPDELDILALVSDRSGRLAVERTVRTSRPGLLPLTPILELVAAARQCTVVSGGLDTLSTAHLHATVTLSCPRKLDTASHGEPTGGAKHLVRSHWLLTAEKSPRQLEHIELHAPPGQDAPALALRFEGKLIDGDDHPDIEAMLQLNGTGDAADASPENQLVSRIPLQWLSRPSGLAVQDGEPERTLVQLADEAATTKAPEAGRKATALLALHKRLCRSAGTSEIALSGQMGLPCPPSQAVARAHSILVATAIARERILDALEHRQALEDPRLRPTPADRKRAEEAIAAAPTSVAFQFSKGPTLSPARTTPVHRPRVAFLDDGRLLLRGTPNQIYILSTKEVAPAGIRSSLAMTDPKGRLAVAEVFRSCQGYRARIVRATQIINGIVAGPDVARPLIMPAQVPSGYPCDKLPSHVRQQSGGFVVLDYSDSGLLLGRGAELLTLPLDSSGESTSDAAQPLTGGRPIPRSKEPIAITTKGSYALPTPAGIAIIRNGRVELVRPPDAQGEVADVALSPSGTRLALTRGRQVWIGTHTGGTPAATSPSEDRPTTPPRALPRPPSRE
ncbi:MAG: hypothetical protein OXR73_27900 [Myxococcales bacterium]|nr:hypothetical protein [Myxococcales bacterium]